MPTKDLTRSAPPRRRAGRAWLLALVAAWPLASALANDTLTASPAGVGDALGRAVALDGIRALVGAPQQPGGTSQGPGFAVVFRDTGGVWVEEDRLAVAGAPNGNGVGLAVALDGDTAAVGAPGADAVHVFTRNGTSWSLQQTLEPVDVVAFEEFGTAVDLAGDRLVVGRPGKGTVEVYERTGTTWNHTAGVEPDTGADFAAQFGCALRLDGDRLFVGAPGFDSLGYDSGAVYRFDLSGGVWQQQQLLEASDGGTVTGLGSSVALAGAYLVAGSQMDTVYVWREVGGVFGDEQRLHPADPGSAGAQWGRRVAADGEWLAVGSENDGGAAQGAGAVFLFRRAKGGYHAQHELRSDSPSFSDAFGAALALEGERLLVGVPGEDDAAVGAGAAEVVGLFPGAPWTDLGNGLPGASLPALTPGGTLVAGAPTALTVEFGPPSSSAALVIGLSAISTPFLGGVMVPDTDLLVLGLPLDGDGALTLGAAWPVGVPAGLALWFQWWVTDPVAPFGLSASNAARVETP